MNSQVYISGSILCCKYSYRIHYSIGRQKYSRKIDKFIIYISVIGIIIQVSTQSCFSVGTAILF
ncbi:DUF2104 domain-containing protein [Candidatus Peregrinibacteria bacterium]|nr:DUF2104 domain-containing protein [Candidatus Peregrinibacteria bacterium]